MKLPLKNTLKEYESVSFLKSFHICPAQTKTQNFLYLIMISLFRLKQSSNNTMNQQSTKKEM